MSTGTPPGSQPPTEPLPICVERRLFFHHSKGDPRLCPRCGGKLEEAAAPLMVLCWIPGVEEPQTLIVGKQGLARYCRNCPTASITTWRMSEYMKNLTPGAHEISFAVVGLLDLNAIPEDQRDVPLDDLEHLPLVHFLQDPPKEEAPARPLPGYLRDRERLKARKNKKNRR